MLRFVVCGVVMLLSVCEIVVDVVVDDRLFAFSLSFVLDDASDSFDFCSVLVADFG